MLLFAPEIGKRVNDDTKNKVEDNDDDNEEEKKVIRTQLVIRISFTAIRKKSTDYKPVFISYIGFIDIINNSNKIKFCNISVKF